MKHFNDLNINEIGRYENSSIYFIILLKNPYIVFDLSYARQQKPYLTRWAHIDNWEIYMPGER